MHSFFFHTLLLSRHGAQEAVSHFARREYQGGGKAEAAVALFLLDASVKRRFLPSAVSGLHEEWSRDHRQGGRRCGCGVLRFLCLSVKSGAHE